MYEVDKAKHLDLENAVGFFSSPLKFSLGKVEGSCTCPESGQSCPPLPIPSQLREPTVSLYTHSEPPGPPRLVFQTPSRTALFPASVEFQVSTGPKPRLKGH